MEIVFLVHQPEKIEEVAEMVYDEFVVKSGSSMQFESVLKHFSNTKLTTYPMTLIAVKNGICLGTVSIVENDLAIRKTYKPWLASLYTKPQYRGQGVGQKLVEKTIEVVKDLGFQTLYLRTEEASDYYKRIGWTYVETVADENYEKIDVFKVNLLGRGHLLD